MVARSRVFDGAVKNVHIAKIKCNFEQYTERSSRKKIASCKIIYASDHQISYVAFVSFFFFLTSIFLCTSHKVGGGKVTHTAKSQPCNDATTSALLSAEFKRAAPNLEPRSRQKNGAQGPAHQTNTHAAVGKREQKMVWIPRPMRGERAKNTTRKAHSAAKVWLLLLLLSYPLLLLLLSLPSICCCHNITRRPRPLLLS